MKNFEKSEKLAKIKNLMNVSKSKINEMIVTRTTNLWSFRIIKIFRRDYGSRAEQFLEKQFLKFISKKYFCSAGDYDKKTFYYRNIVELK